MDRKRIREIAEELTKEQSLALLCADIGRPFHGKKAKKAIEVLRGRELLEKASWSTTELGRHVASILTMGTYRAPSKDPMSHVQEKVMGAMEAITQNSLSVCTKCKASIPKGEKVLWEKNVGMYHHECP